MIDKKELCQKITAIYPDIGECEINIDAEWDDNKKAWIVSLERDGRELKTHLEPEDADACLEGKQCESLGIQIEQLKENLEKTPG